MSSMQRVDQIASHLMPPAAAGLKFRVSNGVAEITLANERQRNPLSYATLKALEEILLSINPGWKYSEDWVGVGSMPEKPTKEQLDRQGDLGKNLAKQGVNLDIGVVVIRAEGPIFSSGHNLKEFSSDDASFQHTLFTQCQRTMLLLRRLPQPTIALLSPHQKVTAAGLQLVSMCDMIIAHEGSEFQYSGVNIGGWCVTPQTPNAHPSRSIPSTYTMGLLLTGDWSPASAALQAGLISKIYSKPEDAWNVVETLAGRNREALVLGKWSFWRMNGGAGAEYEEKFGEITKLVLNMQTMQSVKAGSRGFFNKKK